MGLPLEGKSAIVTGAGAGINLAFARKLLDSGANVVMADLALRPESQEVIEKYKDKPKAIFHRTDVTSWESLTGLFKMAEETFGTIDIVCPGAGVFEPPFSNFWFPPGDLRSKDDPLSDRYASIDINLVHPIRVTQMAISHFLAGAPKACQQNKSIIHIASVAAEIASLMFPLYHATKWGLVGFIRSMAGLDEKFGIRVAGVAPGIVRTPLWTDNEEKMRMVTDERGEVQKTWISPEEVADLMYTLATEDEVDHHGQKIPIAGGSVIEIGSDHLRDVPMLNNAGPPPDNAGMKMIAGQHGADELLAELQKPGWGKY